MRAAVDVGGTFTDVAYWDGTSLRTAKVSTTPDQSDGVLVSISAVDAGGADLVHGTTAATNAVVQRTGARTAFVTDAGFEDVIEIGRQDRPSLYDTEVTRPTPLVPIDLRFGVSGRSTPTGGGATGRSQRCRCRPHCRPTRVGGGIDALRLRPPQREHTVAAAIRAALGDVPISLASEVAAEIREFERASTVILNAYLAPVVERYLRRLADRVEASTTVMRSSGV